MEFDKIDCSKLVCFNSADEEMILPSQDLLGLRVVSIATGQDEGSLFDDLQIGKILMIKYDISGNVVTSGEDSRICVMDKFLNRTYVNTPNPVISFCQTRDENYHFTGSSDMKVTVWSDDWI